MPRRARYVKRKVLPDAVVIAAWSGFFLSGYDFFGELEEIGLYAGDELAHRDAILGAAKTAWRRYGAQFLAENPTPPTGETPWALETFGAP